MRRWIPLVSAMVSVGLVLSACGSSEPAGPVSLDMTMTDDFTYEPSEIAVVRGSEVTITASNNSTVNLEHDLVVLGDVFTGLGDINRAIAADPDIVLAELDLVQSGGSDSVIVTFDEPGEYQFFCRVQGHFAAGMQGTITVEG